jgi:hypothetical protein
VVSINISAVANGVLVNALSATSRMLIASISAIRSRRYAADLAVAQWFDTSAILREGPSLPRLPEATKINLANTLESDEVQAVLQELLAARLTAAPATDITQIRMAWKLTFARTQLDNDRVATITFEFYDEKICTLVSRLAKADPSPLNAIREAAFSARLITVLSAIERHTASLAAAPDRLSELNFLNNYRGQVRDTHGKIEPPDFDRRRRIPLGDIYVDTTICAQEVLPEQERINLMHLARELDRTVLLGDPGTGKTTAVKALMNLYAADESGRVPFLVTLREYASTVPPEQSIISYIERDLGGLYQCPPPPGLIEHLCLSGRAVVLFDGLDELLDTSKRIDITTRVERFAYEYPLTSVLVTSRIVGYGEARLDVSQFASYQIIEFSGQQVREYAHKWFALQEDVIPGEAAAFLSESISVQDLRANPLLLSLMCILYRGEGSLPHDRPGVYRSCAELLFRKWDERRRIHRELRASHLVESAIRYLAWWLFNRDNTQSSVTEDELVDEASRFLFRRGFESIDDASDAAREFVAFCRGRMWVISEAGTNRNGMRLYSFTHRTFLEYFAASWLASACDRPEDLALSLIDHISDSKWAVVDELAIQIKESTTDQGADRIYKALLHGPADQDQTSIALRGRASVEHREALVAFLIRCLRSVIPSPTVVRGIAAEILDAFSSTGFPSGNELTQLSDLLVAAAENRTVVADEIDKRVHELIGKDSKSARMSALLLAMVPGEKIVFRFRRASDPVLRGQVRFWADWVTRQADVLSAAFAAEISTNTWLWTAALRAGFVTIESVMEQPQGLSLLMFERYRISLGRPAPSAYLLWIYDELMDSAEGHSSGRGSEANVHQAADTRLGRMQASALGDFRAIGQYLSDHPQPPWIRVPRGSYDSHSFQPLLLLKDLSIDEFAFLGIAFFVFSVYELEGLNWVLEKPGMDWGPLGSLLSYIDHRRHASRGSSVTAHRQRIELPDLPVPAVATRLLRDWACNQVKFTERVISDSE